MTRIDTDSSRGFFSRGFRRSAFSLGLATLFGASQPAAAADGCAVMMCLSTNWRNIAVCHPIVKEVLKDIRRGRGYPTCNTGGAGTGYEVAWAPGNCPPQYTYLIIGESTNEPRCTMLGVTRVVINGEPWSNVWFDEAGEDTSTEYLSGARRQLTPEQMDPRFERDYANWAATQPPPAPPTPPTPN